MHRFSISLNREQMKAVKVLAKETGMSQADVVRIALKVYLNGPHVQMIIRKKVTA